MVLVSVAIGVMLGSGVVRTYDLVAGGTLAGIVAGALGGWLGGLWWGDAFAAPLAGSGPAGVVAGAAVGSMLLTAIAGATIVEVRRRRG